MAFEQAVMSQILIEHPEFKGKTLYHCESGREYSLESLTHDICSKMWNSFDNALDKIESQSVER
jgi:hypothetical protein